MALTKNRKPPGYNKRTEEQREADMLFCSDLFLRGHSYRDITIRLNEEIKRRTPAPDVPYTLTHKMIYYDLRQALIEWKKERFDNIDDYVTQELVKSYKVEAEAWAAWERSKGGRQRVKERASKGRPRKTDADVIVADYYGYDETTAETSAGDPRFLELAVSTQVRRAKLLGTDAATKIDAGPIKQEIHIATGDKFALDNVPDDVLRAFANAVQDAKRDALLKEKEGGE